MGVLLEKLCCCLRIKSKRVRCQTKVDNCKCSYLLLYFIVLLSKILLLIEFCFIISLIFLIFSPYPKYTSLGVHFCLTTYSLFHWALYPKVEYMFC